MSSKHINPNSDREFIDTADVYKEDIFPKFTLSLKFEPFRHIQKLEINFNQPISIISGINRSGKSTVLMALACSHYDFNKRAVHNGKLERQTWSSMMVFTSHDKQKEDWTYYITYKQGKKIEPKKGQRKADTKKWNGIGKKESQFKDRQVVFIDLDRILPARSFGNTILVKAQAATTSHISANNVSLIEGYLSYILEENFKLNKLADHLDKDIFKYTNSNEYSSYNAATGEEVLTKIIIDSVEAKPHSLILIDEIEIGLHPKIQRRLIHTLYNISRNDKKQFIITSHSATILSSVPDKSRIFIDKINGSTFRAISNISVSAALSKMDSISYPLYDLYCEDREAYKIIQKAIAAIQEEKSNKFSDLVNIVVSGSAYKTYTNFVSHRDTYPFKKVKTGYACILDGDQRFLKNSKGEAIYPPEDCLHFIYSSECPEKFLVKEYVLSNPDPTLLYHVEHSDPHCLFDKMIENAACIDRNDAFEKCWNVFIKTSNGAIYFEELKKFLIRMAKLYSPDL